MILIGNIHCRSVSDDNFPVVDGIHFPEADCNHCDSQNLAEEPSITGVVFPNRSDQSDVFFI